MEEQEKKVEMRGGDSEYTITGVMRFSRSEGPDADRCICCEGPHVFAKGIQIEPMRRVYANSEREIKNFHEWVYEVIASLGNAENKQVQVTFKVLDD